MKIQILNQVVLLAILSATSVGFAADQGFRYKEGKCLNEKNQPGFNPGFFGPCGDLRGVTLGKVNLDGGDFRGAQFQQAQLQVVSFKGAKLEGSDFSNTVLSGVTFDEAQIIGANFTQANLKNATFAEVQMQSVNFNQSVFESSALSYMECQRCTFRDAKMNAILLDSAILNGSDFSGATLRESNFLKADLRDTNFEKTNIVKAILLNTNVTGARFKDAKFNRATQLPFNLERAKELGMFFLKADCNPKLEVEYEDRCYYLDGAEGKCAADYELAPQSILTQIAAKFVGIDYKTKVSGNCCIWHKDIDIEGEDYGMSTDCNAAGPFREGPILNGAGCTDAKNKLKDQLTFCQSIQ